MSRLRGISETVEGGNSRGNLNTREGSMPIPAANCQASPSWYSSAITLDNGTIDKPYYNGQPGKIGKVCDPANLALTEYGTLYL